MKYYLLNASLTEQLPYALSKSIVLLVINYFLIPISTSTSWTRIYETAF